MNNILLVLANQTTIWKGPPLVISFKYGILYDILHLSIAYSKKTVENTIKKCIIY